MAGDAGRASIAKMNASCEQRFATRSRAWRRLRRRWSDGNLLGKTDHGKQDQAHKGRSFPAAFLQRRDGGGIAFHIYWKAFPGGSSEISSGFCRPSRPERQNYGTEIWGDHRRRSRSPERRSLSHRFSAHSFCCISACSCVRNVTHHPDENWLNQICWYRQMNMQPVTMGHSYFQREQMSREEGNSLLDQSTECRALPSCL